MAITLTNVIAAPAGGGRVMVTGTATPSASYDDAAKEVIDLSTYINASADASDGFVCLINGGGGYVGQHTGDAESGTVTYYEAGADSAALDEVANGTNLVPAAGTFIAVGPPPLS